MLPEDRRRDGLVLPSSIRRNISLTALGLSLTRMGMVRQRARARLVRAHRPPAHHAREPRADGRHTLRR